VGGFTAQPAASLRARTRRASSAALRSGRKRRQDRLESIWEITDSRWRGISESPRRHLELGLRPSIGIHMLVAVRKPLELWLERAE